MGTLARPPISSFPADAVTAAGLNLPTGTRPNLEQSVSPSRKAAVFGHLEAPEGDETLGAIATGISRQWDAWCAIGTEHRKRIAGNGVDSPDRLLLQSHRFAKSEANEAGVRVWHAQKMAGEELAKIEAELAKAPEATPVASEIRSYVRGLDKLQRMQFLRRACEAEDSATIAAVLAGPAYLSGLDPETSPRSA